MNPLTRKLEYRFENTRLLEEALTHASKLEAHNERLEYLGDAVLGLVVAEELYRRFPDAREGRLTEMKSLLVSRQTLGRVAARMGLQEHIQTGNSLIVRKSLPRSVLGNALEAILGAIYLDAGPERGLDEARKAALRWLEPELARADQVQERAAAKQMLQLYSQAELGSLPAYRVVDCLEHPETTAFKIQVELGGQTYPPAWGTTKKEAERWAAWEALLCLRGQGKLAGSID